LIERCEIGNGDCLADTECKGQNYCRGVEHTYCRDYLNGTAFCDCLAGFTGIPTQACVGIDEFVDSNAIEFSKLDIV